MLSRASDYRELRDVLNPSQETPFSADFSNQIKGEIDRRHAHVPVLHLAQVTRPENGGADADDCCAFSDRPVKIIRHSHRQFQLAHRVRDLDSISDLAKQCVRGANISLDRGIQPNCHEATELQVF